MDRHHKEHSPNTLSTNKPCDPRYCAVTSLCICLSPLTSTDMEFCSSARAYLAEDLSQIVKGYEEFIKLKVWKPPFPLHYAICGQKRGLFWKVVLEFQCWCLKMTLQICAPSPRTLDPPLGPHRHERKCYYKRKKKFLYVDKFVVFFPSEKNMKRLFDIIFYFKNH